MTKSKPKSMSKSKKRRLKKGKSSVSPSAVSPRSDWASFVPLILHLNLHPQPHPESPNIPVFWRDGDKVPVGYFYGTIEDYRSSHKEYLAKVLFDPSEPIPQWFLPVLKKLLREHELELELNNLDIREDIE